jgi:AcrR family transcriptional regulator
MPTVKKPRAADEARSRVDDVVAAAIEILDRGGVDEVTIRRVAEACGPSLTAAALRPTGSRRSDERRSPWVT